MQTDHENINQFDTNERYDYAPKSPNQQISAKQSVGSKGLVLDSFECDRNQQRGLLDSRTCTRDSSRSTLKRDRSKDHMDKYT
jgi:hypothetical protein